MANKYLKIKSLDSWSIRVIETIDVFKLFTTFIYEIAKIFELRYMTNLNTIQISNLNTEKSKDV